MLCKTEKGAGKAISTLATGILAGLIVGAVLTWLVVPHTRERTAYELAALLVAVACLHFSVSYARNRPPTGPTTATPEFRALEEQLRALARQLDGEREALRRTRHAHQQERELLHAQQQELTQRQTTWERNREVELIEAFALGMVQGSQTTAAPAVPASVLDLDHYRHDRASEPAGTTSTRQEAEQEPTPTTRQTTTTDHDETEEPTRGIN